MNCISARTVAFFLLLVTSVFAQQLKGAGSFEISGTVVDAATGHPLAQVRVAIAPVTARSSFRVVITGQDGAFRFEGVSKGKHTLIAQRRGYLTQAYDQHDQYSTSIAVGPGLEARGLVFRLHSEGTISGKITDEANEPVDAANISLFQESPLGEPQTMVLRRVIGSDDEGNYHFAHLQPGKYFLMVSAEPWYARHLSHAFAIAHIKTSKGESYGASPPEISAEDGPSVDVVYPTTYYPGVTDAASAGAIDLAPGERFTADLILQPTRAMPVRVTVGSPDSKRHYSVSLSQKGMGGQLRGMSAATTEISPGVLEITGIVPGRYVMNVNSWGEDTATVENSGNSEKEIDIDSSGTVHAYSEPQNAAMSGMVKFDQGEKDQTFPANAFIYLRNKKTGQVLYAPISDKGEYEFKNGVPAGAYDITVSNLRDAFTRSITTTGAKITGQTLQITGRNAVNANIVLTRGIGHVEGTALFEDKPIAGVMVVLAPEDPANNVWLFRRDQTDSDGTFTLNSVLPGKYTVVAIQDGWKLDYRSPEVLKRFMAQGTPVQVAPHGKYDIKVKVQPANTP